MAKREKIEGLMRKAGICWSGIVIIEKLVEDIYIVTAYLSEYIDPSSTSRDTRVCDKFFTVEVDLNNHRCDKHSLTYI